MKIGRKAATPDEWNTFLRKYRAEMTATENIRIIDLLAALSREVDFSVGCYCAEEEHCHRSVLRALLAERGAQVIQE